MKILIIYHKKCPDGMGAAWCFYYFSKKLGWPKNEIDYHPAAYYEDPPDLKDYHDVYIVDFSYSADITLKMKSSIPGRLVVLDHHESAITNLEPIKSNPVPDLDLILDDKRSGAQIAWDYFSKRSRPWFIDYIGDRDLWTFKLDHSKEVNSALAIEYFNFNSIEKLSELLLKSADDFVKPGECYLRMEKYLLNDICSKAFKAVFPDAGPSNGTKKNTPKYNVYVVEANVLISEVGDHLLNNPPDGSVDFIVIWRYSHFYNTFNYSIRCKDTGPDLSIIAKKFGGGGHKQAAGFSTRQFLF